jgi:ATP-dependent protease ClpP protease subunit
MRAVPCPVNTWALGSADSAGAIILAAGTGRRRVLPHTVVSLHFNEEDGGDAWSDDRIGRERDDAFWRSRAKLPAEFFPVTGDKEFNLPAAEAVRYGIADEVFDRRPDLAPKAPEGR